MSTDTQITRSTLLSAPGVREWLRDEMRSVLIPASPSMVAFRLHGWWKIEVASTGVVGLDGKSLPHIKTVGDLVDLVRGLTGREMEVDR